MPESQRLFLALWPSSPLSRRLHRLARNYLRSGGRGVAPENIHLTLAFLGPVDAAFRECAEQAASAARAKPFTLMLEQAGCWPESGILWVGPRKIPVPLRQLVQVLNAGLVSCGYVPAERPFVPHVTLARKVRCFKGRPSIEPLKWDVREFCLVQSHTRAEGVCYEILRSWPLTPL